MKPDRATLIGLYTDQRLATRQIAATYDVSHMSVKRWLKAYGIPRRHAGRGLLNRGVQEPTADALRRMIHDQHLSYREIGLLYGVDQSAVQHWLKRHGILPPTIWGTRRKGVPMPNPDPAELQTRYQGGEPLWRIAQTLGVSRYWLTKYCREHGIAVRADGWQGGRRWVCSDGHKVQSSYEQRVDDWLSARMLVHEPAPLLPFDRRFRADFLVAGVTYIEIWGVVGSTRYDEAREVKTQLYRTHGLRLIELPAWSFGRRNWLTRLVPLLTR